MANRCTCCGDEIPAPHRTCREYCDEVARVLGDTISEDEANALAVLRLLCLLSEALASGAEEIGEP
jgi:hypothetical protein